MIRAPQLEEIKAAANARAFDVLAALGVRDRSRSGTILISNPMRKDVHPSFAIWPARGGVLSFKDFTGCAQGDIIDLVAYLKGWSAGNDRAGRREALRWLADFLGLERLSPAQRAADAARSIAVARQEEKRDAENLVRKRGVAFKMWVEARPIVGTRGDAYLKARGIDLDALPRGPRGGGRMPNMLRYLPDHAHGESGLLLPCMITGCTDCETQEILAVHRTWLNKFGDAKADVTPNRKVWPDFRGLVIPLWRGDSGLSVREAAAAGLRETLVLAEGIETALSVAVAAPQYRTWAFISLGNLQNVTLPACIDAVALHRENEWDNAAAQKSFARGKAALEKQGRPVADVSAPVGKDLNDTLRGAA
jgi:hypothetical protein